MNIHYTVCPVRALPQRSLPLSPMSGSVRKVSMCTTNAGDDIRTLLGTLFWRPPRFWPAGSSALRASDTPRQPPPTRTGVAAGPWVPPGNFV